MTDPERLDLPHASDAWARRRCLGREELLRRLRAEGLLKPVTASPDALSGTRIHGAWAGELAPDGKNFEDILEDDERETLERMVRLERLIVADWSHGEPCTEFAREQRLWLHIGLQPRHSGRFDVAYVQQAPGLLRMLIIDAKTGYNPVAPADSNDQLRELVALAHVNYPAIAEFTAAIIQPRAEVRSSVALYDSFEAELALRLLKQHLEDIRDPFHQLNPGPFCRYCPALEHCPAVRNEIVVLSDFALDTSPSLVLPIGTEGKVLLDRLKAVGPMVARLLESYKELLKSDPEAVPGWHLKEGKSVRELGDALATWEALKSTLDLADYLPALKVSVSALEKAYGHKTGLKGKALKERFNEVTGEVLSYRQNAPELEKE